MGFRDSVLDATKGLEEFYSPAERVAFAADMIKESGIKVGDAASAMKKEGTEAFTAIEGMLLRVRLFGKDAQTQMGTLMAASNETLISVVSSFDAITRVAAESHLLKRE